MLVKKFQEQVKKCPDHIAVKTINAELSYRELDELAHILAYEITSKYNSADCKVALLFDHGMDMIIGTIGALKAGSIYVPMDLNYPRKLLGHMLEDSEVNLIVTNNKNIDLASDLVNEINSEIVIVNINEIKSTEVKKELSLECDGSGIVYILYTSGSTGRPKGILQSHRNVLHFVESYGKAISIASTDKMTLLSSFSHDAAIVDIYSALLNGATLYPFDVKSQVCMRDVVKWLKDEEITIWHSVPTLYRYLVNEIKERDEFSALRLIVLGGESVLLNDIKLFQKRFRGSEFAIIYGQTESSINSMQFFLTDDEVKRITLGKPVKETELVVVDKNREEVSPLNSGEIIVLSNYVALGYWKDENRSREVFRDIPGIGRSYSTGDLGKLLLDGSIEFLGRLDNQVKVRGFRIELGEIESCLLEDERIREAVVTAFEEETGDKYICAYIVSDKEIEVSDQR
ncbi:MAG: amino acid adenylation domain-containing protein, partial [Oscillospiraceae bacterium]|nr:amino acid adenylation domain-containing protein [Oscillospiraceae bacterium]